MGYSILLKRYVKTALFFTWGNLTQTEKVNKIIKIKCYCDTCKGRNRKCGNSGNEEFKEKPLNLFPNLETSKVYGCNKCGYWNKIIIKRSQKK